MGRFLLFTAPPSVRLRARKHTVKALAFYNEIWLSEREYPMGALSMFLQFTDQTMSQTKGRDKIKKKKKKSALLNFQ